MAKIQTFEVSPLSWQRPPGKRAGVIKSTLLGPAWRDRVGENRFPLDAGMGLVSTVENNASEVHKIAFPANRIAKQVGVEDECFVAVASVDFLHGDGDTLVGDVPLGPGSFDGGGQERPVVHIQPRVTGFGLNLWKIEDCFLFRERLQPDVGEAHPGAVRLQADGSPQCTVVCLLGKPPGGLRRNLHIVMDGYAVEQDGDSRRGDLLTSFKAGSFEDHLHVLPASRLGAGRPVRGFDPIDGATAGFVELLLAGGIQDLDLIAAVEIDAAVPAPDPMDIGR